MGNLKSKEDIHITISKRNHILKLKLPRQWLSIKYVCNQNSMSLRWAVEWALIIQLAWWPFYFVTKDVGKLNNQRRHSHYYNMEKKPHFKTEITKAVVVTNKKYSNNDSLCLEKWHAVKNEDIRITRMKQN